MPGRGKETVTQNTTVGLVAECPEHRRAETPTQTPQHVCSATGRTLYKDLNGEIIADDLCPHEKDKFVKGCWLPYFIALGISVPVIEREKFVDASGVEHERKVVTGHRLRSDTYEPETLDFAEEWQEEAA